MLFNMNILHLSDTHGAHRSLGSLPEADVIVHSGDNYHERLILGSAGLYEVVQRTPLCS